jgi:hypothetical protein
MLLTQDRLDLGYKCVHSKDDYKFFITQNLQTAECEAHKGPILRLNTLHSLSY